MLKQVFFFCLVILLSNACLGESPISFSRPTINNTQINLIKLDLSSPDIEIRPILAPSGDSLPVQSLLAQGGHPTAAITGTFFDLATNIVVGNVVSNGRLLSEGSVGSVLRIDDAQIAKIDSLQGKLGRHVDWSGTKFAISAGPTLIVDGEVAIAPASEGFRDRGLYGYRIRAAMGVTASNKLLLLTTRRPVSLHELAAIFLKLGAADAVNLDGGSSTALAYNNSIITSPHRKLTNLIGIYQTGKAPSQAEALGDQYAKAYEHSLIAQRLWKQGDLIKAHSQMRKAIAMAPDRAPYWEMLAKIQEAARKNLDSASSFAKAAQLYLERSQSLKVHACALNAFRLNPELKSLHPELNQALEEVSATPLSN